MFISSTFEEGVVPTVFCCNSIAQFKVLQYLLQNLKVLQYVLPNFQVLQKVLQYFQSIAKVIEKSIAKFQSIAKKIVIFCATEFFKLC